MSIIPPSCDPLDPDGLLPPGRAVAYALPRPLPTRADLRIPPTLPVDHVYFEYPPGDPTWPYCCLLRIGTVVDAQPAAGTLPTGALWFQRQTFGAPPRTYQPWLAWTWRRGAPIVAEWRWNPTDGAEKQVRGLEHPDAWRDVADALEWLDVIDVDPRGRPRGPKRLESNPEWWSMVRELRDRRDAYPDESMQACITHLGFPDGVDADTREWNAYYWLTRLRKLEAQGIFHTIIHSDRGRGA